MPASLTAIERFYSERYPQLLRVATAIVGEAELARDVVHDAFVSAIVSRASLRDEASVEPWLWRILTNACYAELRRPRRALPAVDPEAQAAEPRDWTAVRRLLAALPERRRTVIFLRYYADLDYAAIADALAISPGTVGATLNAARRTLRQALEEVPT